MKKRVYAARVKDTAPTPNWNGEWHRVKTNANKAGEWSTRKGAKLALKSALSNDDDLIGHVFSYKIDAAPTLETIKIDEWLEGNVVAISDVPAKFRPRYRDTLQRAALAGYRANQVVHVNSSFRTRAEQEVLYAKYLAGTGPLAAIPGTSPHERGIALDIPDVRDNKKLIKQMRKLKLVDDVPSERWHLTSHA